MEAQFGGPKKRRTVIRNCILRISLALAAVLVAGMGTETRSEEKGTAEKSITDARVALRHRHYSLAVRTLEEALQRFPGDSRLRVELGRAYVYERRDAQAAEIFRAVLRDEPSSREAKLELARVLSYRAKYDSSNQLFHELLEADPNDEAAAIGLVRNLLFQNKKAEATHEVEQALARHPNSLRLQEYRDDLQKNQMPLPPSPEANALNRVQADGSYFSDTTGNRAWRFGQRLDVQLGTNFSNSFRLDEKSLWVSQGPKANMLSFNDEGRVRLRHWLFVGAGGGIVRFSDDSNRALYRAELILHPFRNFWLQGGYSRIPIAPTYQAAQLDLLAEGWWTRLDWQPRFWRISADFAKQHYSDSNRTQREDIELLRWIGNSRFALGLGYGYAHSLFAQSLSNGYFSPNRYQNHLALGGFRFSVGKVYSGEYIAQYGAESVDQGPYQFAWQAAAKNRLSFGKVDVGADYTYFHLAQSTGAFRAQVGRLSLAYRF
jgi:tetratricopeptide (TPR) repeat protein